MHKKFLILFSLKKKMSVNNLIVKNQREKKIQKSIILIKIAREKTTDLFIKLFCTFLTKLTTQEIKQNEFILI